ncbi:MAG: DUF2924 domain-containing protein [Rhodobacteraceae bacterium]|nr:DUF2924 domain-containing protein [Paracoccaceae bacterium]
MKQRADGTPELAQRDESRRGGATGGGTGTPADAATRPDRAALRAEWAAAFGTPPHPYLSERFLAKALAWQRQCAAAGGFPRSLGKRLDLIGPGGSGRTQPAASLAPGTLLAREWNGRIHHVEVLEDGFRFDGRSFRSLSAIARRITGTPWSGPRFFGLRRRKADG